ncbi:arylsulfotransferase family protein [Maioricimonas sp. JC845]|uniref:arylsulfotransferase family protein n=1 Tax=Maioricimonas sp. JC845 TaxID=3232138 RepID=UPI00345B1C64
MDKPADSAQPSRPIPADAHDRTDRLLYIGFLVGLGGLSLQLGMLLAAVDAPVYQVTRDGVQAARALFAQREMTAAQWPQHLWYPTRHDAQGLVSSDAESCEPGFTLYTSGHANVALLLDLEGNEVHRWEVPFHAVFGEAKHLNSHVPDACIYIRRAHVFPNGDLLALYETPATTPPGRGLARLDVDGNVLWTFAAATHHDFGIGPDGTIYVLTQSLRTEPHPQMSLLSPPLIEEKISILSPDGEEQKTLSLFDLFGSSPYYRPVVTLRDRAGDVFHSNTVNVIGPGFASHHEGVDAGDLMVCLRNLNLVIVVDPESEEIVWATSGPWHYPHDPDPLENGHILIFDNCATRGTTVGSRVIEFDPTTGGIVREFAGTEDAPLISHIRSCQQLLENGNLLVTESDAGRLLEVTPAGDVVWEYVNPVRGGDEGELTPVVSGGVRYRPEELPFLKSRTARPQVAQASAGE